MLILKKRDGKGPRMSKMASSLSGPAHTRKFAHCRLISTGNAHFGKTYAIYTHCNLHARGSQRKSPEGNHPTILFDFNYHYRQMK